MTDRSTTSSTPSNASRRPPGRPECCPSRSCSSRAENFLHGRPDLDDTIRRLQAFEKAGADVLYAPGLAKAEDIRAVCSAVRKPVNVVMGLKSAPFSVADLAALGVKRISVGSSLARAALSGFVDAAREIRERGTFTFAEEILSFAAASEMVAEPSRNDR